MKSKIERERERERITEKKKTVNFRKSDFHRSILQ